MPGRILSGLRSDKSKQRLYLVKEDNYGRLKSVKNIILVKKSKLNKKASIVTHKNVYNYMNPVKKPRTVQRRNNFYPRGHYRDRKNKRELYGLQHQQPPFTASPSATYQNSVNKNPLKTQLLSNSHSIEITDEKNAKTINIQRILDPNMRVQNSNAVTMPVFNVKSLANKGAAPQPDARPPNAMNSGVTSNFIELIKKMPPYSSNLSPKDGDKNKHENNEKLKGKMTSYRTIRSQLTDALRGGLDAGVWLALKSGMNMGVASVYNKSAMANVYDCYTQAVKIGINEGLRILDRTKYETTNALSKQMGGVQMAFRAQKPSVKAENSPTNKKLDKDISKDKLIHRDISKDKRDANPGVTKPERKEEKLQKNRKEGQKEGQKESKEENKHNPSVVKKVKKQKNKKIRKSRGDNKAHVNKETNGKTSQVLEATKNRRNSKLPGSKLSENPASENSNIAKPTTNTNKPPLKPTNNLQSSSSDPKVGKEPTSNKKGVGTLDQNKPKKKPDSVKTSATYKKPIKTRSSTKKSHTNYSKPAIVNLDLHSRLAK